MRSPETIHHATASPYQTLFGLKASSNTSNNGSYLEQWGRTRKPASVGNDSRGFWLNKPARANASWFIIEPTCQPSAHHRRSCLPFSVCHFSFSIAPRSHLQMEN